MARRRLQPGSRWEQHDEVVFGSDLPIDIEGRVLRFYNLAEQPFGVTPDSRYLYLSPTHREGLASALYGVTSGRGFTALIARPGMGKTTLLFDFLQQVQRSSRTVFLFQPQYSPCDLLRSLLADLGIEEDGSDPVRMHRKLNDVLLRESSQGRRLVVVIDEAQNLEEPVLEFVRMLSNFETPREKLMYVMLAGQPQLAEKLASARLIQLRQRISIIAHLKPFDAEETRLYINHRLRVAGYEFAKPLFTKQAEAIIAKHTEGIPRNINNVCFNAMSLGCVAGKETIDVDVIQEVLGDLNLSTLFEETDQYRTKGRTIRRPARSMAKREKILKRNTLAIPSPSLETASFTAWERSASVSKADKPNPPVPDLLSSKPTRPFLAGWPLRLGQTILIPSIESTSQTIHLATLRVPDARAAEPEKP